MENENSIGEVDFRSPTKQYGSHKEESGYKGITNEKLVGVNLYSLPHLRLIFHKL